MTYEPRPYQLAGIDKLAASVQTYGTGLDMSDMGTGKTWKALFVAKRWGLPVAVVCPAVTKVQWRDAADKLGVEMTLCESYQKVIRGTATGITKSGVKRRKFSFALTKPTLFVFDEVHACRNHKSQNSLLLMDCVDAGYPVLMLSATPFENTTQFRAIGHALKIVHRNKWWHWCLSAGGCRPGSFGGLEYVGGEQTMSQIRSTWDDRMDRTRIEDVGDLPEFTMQTRLIDSNNCKAINNAYTELLATYAEETEFAIVRRLRYRQKIEHEKIKQLYELAQEFVDGGQKVIHFVNFTDTVDTLYELHEGEFGIVDGRVTGDKRQAVVDQFQAGKLDGLIVQLQSGGVGLNLQDTTGDAPRTAILNLTDSATLFRQATGRTFRDGSRSACRFVVPLVAGTVEKEIEQNLERKFRNLASLTDADFRP